MISRNLYKSIRARLGQGKAVVVFGARQVGKTTLVRALLEDCYERVLRLNGDEPDVRSSLENATSSQLRMLCAGHDAIFIDEAQRIPNIGLTIKLLVDEIPEVQTVATGSSAFELADRIQEPLTGRKFEFHLYPLSYREMAEHHSLLEERRLLEQRLVYGFYPEIVTHPDDARERLLLLADSYLYKDLLMLEDIKKPGLLEKILRALALQLGSEVSYAEIASLVGSDRATVEKYIELLEKVYVVFRLPAFSRNARNEIRKGRKIYFHDLGIRNALLGSFQPVANRTDIGSLWENFLIVERMKTMEAEMKRVKRYFWRTTQKQEIDYIEEQNEQLLACEFKWNPRKQRALPAPFTRSYPNATAAHVSRNVYEDFVLGNVPK